MCRSQTAQHVELQTEMARYTYDLAASTGSELYLKLASISQALPAAAPPHCLILGPLLDSAPLLVAERPAVCWWTKS